MGADVFALVATYTQSLINGYALIRAALNNIFGADFRTFSAEGTA